MYIISTRCAQARVNFSPEDLTIVTRVTIAEAARLAIGAVGLAGLFTTCVERIDYVSLGRNHSRDYELSMTKLTLLKARLDAWGESLQVLHKGKENTALQNHWLEEQGTVGKCLVGIKSILEDDKRMKSRYGLK